MCAFPSPHGPGLEGSAEAGSDLVLLLNALSATTTDEVQRRVAEASFGDLRPSHGHVFQHLQGGPITISGLAERLGVTHQGASKVVIELEDFGYLVRQPDPADQRIRRVALTDRGREAIAAGRKARAAVNEELRAILGANAEAFGASLRALTERTDVAARLAGRQLGP
jgi:DNA-binding MarR family transcriptional regulator